MKELGAREVKRANEEARIKKSSPLRPDMSHMLARSALPVGLRGFEQTKTERVDRSERCDGVV